jgi:hypothetical protein
LAVIVLIGAGAGLKYAWKKRKEAKEAQQEPKA